MSIGGREDCVAVSFPSEAETVVFLPNSGEVLLCSTESWKEISTSGVLDSNTPYLPDFSADAENVLATLERLGINLS